MSDLDSFLTAIEAEPLDDALWLVFADWLEERGEPISEIVRKTVGDGDWYRLDATLIERLAPRQARQVACECLLRVLPLFEKKYPEDQSPRLYLETLMCFATGKRVNSAKAALDPSSRAATEDFYRDPRGFDFAFTVIMNICNIRLRGPFLLLSFHNCAAIAARNAFGPDADVSITIVNPRFRSLLNAEYRWQSARILRRLTA